MKHPSSRDLYAYWDAQRGNRPAPERGDIEPGAIRHLLGDSFILALDAARGHPFRLAGTRVCALFGRELKDEPFTVWDARDRGRSRDLIDILADECVGVVAGVDARTNVDGAPIDLELLLLPLGHRGTASARPSACSHR